MHSRGKRFPDPLNVFIDDYRPYYDYLKQEGRLDCWLKSQGYLAIANMMTGSALMGIQSCAIEGYNEMQVLDVLSLMGISGKLPCSLPSAILLKQSGRRFARAWRTWFSTIREGQ